MFEPIRRQGEIRTHIVQHCRAFTSVSEVSGFLLGKHSSSPPRKYVSDIIPKSNRRRDFNEPIYA